jgi:hypothetical protein
MVRSTVARCLPLSRFRVWLMTMPLIVAGCEGAHAFLGRVMLVDGGRDRELLEGGGFGSSLLPLVLAVGAALVLVGFGMLATHRTLGEHRRIARWVFVALPISAFALQEQFEYAVAHGRPSPAVFASGSFLVGIALQLPVAVVAYGLARLLFRVADLLGGPRPEDDSRGQRYRIARHWSLIGSERRWRVPVATDPTRGPPVGAFA